MTTYNIVVGMLYMDSISERFSWHIPENALTCLYRPLLNTRMTIMDHYLEIPLGPYAGGS